jgi:hypothetical protein
MPTLQVINREPDGSAEAIGRAGNDIVEAIHKTQALKQTAEYYKILAKNADTEIKKHEFERKAKGVEYIASITERIKDPQMRGLAFKSGMDAGIIDFDSINDGANKAKEYFDILTQRTEGEKADLAEQSAETSLKQNTADLYKRVLSGQNGGGDMSSLPPGSSFSGGGLTIPLNQKLTESEQATIGGAENIQSYVDQLMPKLDELDFNNEASKIGIDSGEPYFAQGELGAIQSLQQSLKQIIPFAKGGKALSKNESERLEKLLNFRGKERERAKRDIQSFVTEFNTMRSLALGGANAANFKSNSPGAKAVKEMSSNNKSKYVRTGIDSETGKRVGQLADGTIEEIGQ